MKDLTKRQKEVLDYITSYQRENGYPPTFREIADTFNMVSTFGVTRHVDALVKKGYLTKEDKSSRTLIPINAEKINLSEIVKIPILGRVAAGMPILAIENYDGHIVLDASMVKNHSECYALRVKGDSMINAGIFENDVVIVKSVNNAKNGDIVVALIDGEATVKTLKVTAKNVMLLPHNEAYKPIVVNNLENFSIIGKVIGVYRNLN